jgi:hypothetical protein
MKSRAFHLEKTIDHAAIAISGLDRVSDAGQQARLLAEGLRRRCWRLIMVAASVSGGAATAGMVKASQLPVVRNDID